MYIFNLDEITLSGIGVINVTLNFETTSTRLKFHQPCFVSIKLSLSTQCQH